jgi:hypothetical protein
MMPKVFVSSSNSTVQVSTASSYASAFAGGKRQEGNTASGAISINQDGVALNVSYYLALTGLHTIITAIDLDDPDETSAHEVVILKEGERRIIEVPRSSGKPSAVFTIIRLGNGVQVAPGRV